jgi:type IV pilus assembly protein PilY1
MMKSLMLGAGMAALLPFAASATAIIDNGVIQLGVDDLGQLNVPGGVASPVDGTTAVGLRHMPTGLESTSHGCLCEGWGVGIADAGGARIASGSANNALGVSNLALVSFGSTASTATSVTELLGDGGASLLRITHAFGPAAETPNLYRVNVSVENISGSLVEDLRYTRTFDWDVEPESFSEVVTHQGVATTPSVLSAVDDGFADSDPFILRSEIVAGGTGDFVDLGPDDHGSNFDFGFGGLAAGEVFEFDIFYGAARTEAEALASLGEVGAEVFSLGQAGSDPDGTGFSATGAKTATFIFGFSGVGGEIIIDDPTPEPDVPDVPLPAAVWLMGAGIAGLGGLRALRGRG